MKLDMNSLMKQAQKMQDQIAKVQSELGNVTVEGSSGGGMVTAKASADLKLLSLKIDPDVMGEDIEMLEDLVIAAINQAFSRAQEAATEHMNKATGGLMGGMPGGMKMPFGGM